MTYTIFTGCSFTEGIGLENTKLNPNLWTNIVHNKFNSLKDTKLLNLGVGGSTNDEIFYDTVSAVGTYDCKYLFVAWTSFTRYKINPGVELYDTKLYLSPTTELSDLNLNAGVTYTKKFLSNFRDSMLMLNHDHYHYLKILNYSYTIKMLCKRLNITVFFINTLLPHDAEYFYPVTTEGRVPSDTTVYTQQELNAKTRDDKEFFEIYDQVHKSYAKTGGLDCAWLNLDTGFRKNFNLDLGLDNFHPGVSSHQTFGAHLIEKLQGRGLE